MTIPLICSVYFFIAGTFFKDEWEPRESLPIKAGIFIGSIFWLPLFTFGCFLWLIVTFCIPSKAKETK